MRWWHDRSTDGTTHISDAKALYPIGHYTVRPALSVGGATTYAKEIFEYPQKEGAILHVSAGILARSLIPKVGSLREIISTHLGAAISLTDHTNCNRDGVEIPVDRLPNACKTENLVGYKRVVPSSNWVKREPIPHFPNYPYKAGALTSA